MQTESKCASYPSQMDIMKTCIKLVHRCRGRLLWRGEKISLLMRFHLYIFLELFECVFDLKRWQEVSSIHWNERPYLLNFCQEPFGATMKCTLSFNIFIYKMYHIDDALYKALYHYKSNITWRWKATWQRVYISIRQI